MGTGALQLTADTFRSTIDGSDKPVLVDFWASWCPPCRAIAPAIEQLAQEKAGTAVVAKLDIDAAQSVAMQYRVNSIPTLIIFKNGREVDRMVGALPKGVIEQRLAAAL